MKVYIPHTISYEGKLLKRGKRYDLPDKVAKYYISNGFAKEEKIKDEKQTKVVGPDTNKEEIVPKKRRGRPKKDVSGS